MIDKGLAKARVRARSALLSFRPVRKLRWHMADPRRLPIVRRRFEGWQDGDAEYQRSGEAK